LGRRGVVAGLAAHGAGLAAHGAGIALLRAISGHDDASMAIAPIVLAFSADRAELREIAADGECVRIRWCNGEALLMPTGRRLSARDKARKSLALQKRLRALVGRPAGNPSP
jgi:hypothetical protein